MTFAAAGTVTFAESPWRRPVSVARVRLNRTAAAVVWAPGVVPAPSAPGAPGVVGVVGVVGFAGAGTLGAGAM